MSNPDILFKGVPKANVRGFAKSAIEQMKPKRVVIPCSGAFAFCNSAAMAGIPPKEIATCDITLYTSAIGLYLRGEDFRLEIHEQAKDWHWLREYMDDPLGKAASVILGIRMLQYTRMKESHFRDSRLREFHERSDQFIDAAKKSLLGHHASLGGLDYRAGDMRDLIEEHMGDRDTLIMCAPPWYGGGYDKMFEGVDEVFDWDEPAVRQFDPDEEWPVLVDNLGNAPATCMLLYATPLSDCHDPAPMFGDSWTSVYADRPKRSGDCAVSWFVTNKPEKLETTFHRADIPKRVKAKYRLLLEEPITMKSDIRAVSEKGDVVSYYRDLLVHNLGMKGTSDHIVLLVDGMLAGAMGFHMTEFYHTGELAKQTFCFTPEHHRYPRLHKLALLSMCSSWFWDEKFQPIFGTPSRIQTSMWTNKPQVMTARGIFKLKEREVLKKGPYKYRLSYYGDVVKRTRKETLQLWLSKWGKEK